MSRDSDDVKAVSIAHTLLCAVRHPSHPLILCELTAFRVRSRCELYGFGLLKDFDDDFSARLVHIEAAVRVEVIAEVDIFIVEVQIFVHYADSILPIAVVIGAMVAVACSTSLTGLLSF